MFVDKIDDLVRKLLTVSGTSFAFAGFTMAWLNSYLSKSVPNVDNKKQCEQCEDDTKLNNTQSTAFSIPYEYLEALFIILASSGVGVLIGVAFIAYEVSLVLRKMKSIDVDRDDNFLRDIKRLQRWSKFCHILLCFGVTLAFLSVAFSILVFHSSSILAFICFLLPLAICTFLAGVAFYLL